MIAIKYEDESGNKTIVAYMISSLYELVDKVDISSGYYKRLSNTLDSINTFTGECLYQYWIELDNNIDKFSYDRYIYIIINDRLIRLQLMSILNRIDTNKVCVMYAGDKEIGRSEQVEQLYNICKMSLDVDCKDYDVDNTTYSSSTEQIQELIDSCSETSEQSE